MLQGSWGEAAKKLAEVVDDDTFRSLEGKSKHQLWLELCDIITRHPDLVRGMKVDAILRSGIRKFTDEVAVQNDLAAVIIQCYAWQTLRGMLGRSGSPSFGKVGASGGALKGKREGG